MKIDYALLIIRLVFGFRLIYGTYDNIIDWNRMLEFRDFLDHYDFPFPLIAAIISVFGQFLAGLAWTLGYQVRIFSLVMIINFIVAIVGVHILGGDDYRETAPAVHLLAVALVLYLVGPGRFALDRKVRVE